MKIIKNFTPVIFILCLFALLGIFISRGNMQLFNPQGFIAMQERNLIISAVLIMLIIAIPFLISAIVISWHYRAGNSKTKYKPDEQSSTLMQIILWVIPTIIILILSYNMWVATHKLDPFKSINSDNKPITIQVVALRWKWLFIYPKLNIATVNYIQLPVNTPVVFNLTADGPMNSFWIPQLSGQIYSMAGMGTKLNLIANNIGKYTGYNAEISGKGFADMNFTVNVTSKTDFDMWVNLVKKSKNTLDFAQYESLAIPSEDNSVSYYVLKDNNLYNEVILKFILPPVKNTQTEKMQ